MSGCFVTAPVGLRFLAKVKVGDDDTCWTWEAAKNRKGYGVFRADPDRSMVQAHRFSYELVTGAVPAGLEIDHLCSNRACVNPKHLEPVTHAENVARGSRARQTHCKHGHPFDEENTYIRPRGGRGCRACNREACRRYEAKARVAP